MTEFEHELRGGIRAKGALRHVEELVALGRRSVGGDGDAVAAGYVRRAFSSLGLETDDTGFSAFGCHHTAAEVHVLATGDVLEGIPPYFSPPTPAEELVFAGSGEDEDYAGLDVAGKIVLIQESGVGYSRFWLVGFAASAARKGAAAKAVGDMAAVAFWRPANADELPVGP